MQFFNYLFLFLNQNLRPTQKPRNASSSVFFNSRQTIQNKKFSYKNLQAEYLLIFSDHRDISPP